MTSTFTGYIGRLRQLIREQAAGTQPISTDEFDALALALFALQFRHNEAYHRFCLARGVTPASARDWKQIPAIPTVAFKEFELTSLAQGERTTAFHSSGTTDQRPSRHFHNAESLAVYEASLLPWFRVNLLPETSTPPPRLCCLTPSPALAPQSSLVHMFEVVRRELGAPSSVFAGRVEGGDAWTLDTAAVVSILETATRSQEPVLVVGTAFSFVHLLDYFGERKRFGLPPGSRVMETGGYKGRARQIPKDELHVLITRCFGVPPSNIVCEYGMSELSSQAYDAVVDPAGAGPREPGQSPWRFRFPPWARVQLVSPETGKEVAESETGLIRVWDLANVRSVMAIQTEDIGIRRAAGFELIGRVSRAEPRGCSLMAT